VFTGIIEALGRVRSLADGLLIVDLDQSLGPDSVVEGESIAINGCCLTVVAPLDSLELRFDLSPETLSRTSLGQLATGSHVNIERAMRADGRFGGHIVQGHVDATGVLVSATPAGNSTVFRFQVPAGDERYLIDKGSVTIDGISLTVVKPEENEFDVWVIPHTIEQTNLGELKPGDRVNLEYDALARYVEKLLKSSVIP
jgi:riboflavin synthase